jgi:hypothetical protein
MHAQHKETGIFLMQRSNSLCNKLQLHALCCVGSGKQQQQPARFNQPINFVSSGVVGSDPMEIRPALQRVTQVMPDQAQPAEPSQTPNIAEAGQGE